MHEYQKGFSILISLWAVVAGGGTEALRGSQAGDARGVRGKQTDIVYNRLEANSKALTELQSKPGS